MATHSYKSGNDPGRTSSVSGRICSQATLRHTTCVLLVYSCCILISDAQQISFWRGGDGNWSSANRWNPSTVPTAATDVVFDSALDGIGGVVFLNPAGGRREARSITFAEGSGPYVFSVNGSADPKILYIGEGGITNNSLATQTFGGELNLTASQTWAVNRGDVVVENVVSLGANDLTITGGGNVIIHSDVTGSGDLVKSGTGTLFVNSEPTFTGSTYLQDGTLQYGVTLQNGGPLILAGGNLAANDQELSFSSLLLSGYASITLGIDGLAQNITFDSISYDSGTLTIYNWQSGSSGDGIFLPNQPSQEFLNHVSFEGYLPGAQWVDGILVPVVPEPTTLASLFAAGLACLCRRALKQRRRGRPVNGTADV